MNYISRNLLLGQKKNAAGFSIDIEGCFRICVEILKNNQNTLEKSWKPFCLLFVFHFIELPYFYSSFILTLALICTCSRF